MLPYPKNIHVFYPKPNTPQILYFEVFVAICYVKTSEAEMPLCPVISGTDTNVFAFSL